MRALLFTLLISVFQQTALSAPYSIKDLQALEKNESFEEFLRHAHDIRPTQRNQLWLEMVSHMATRYIETVKNRKDFRKKTFEFVENIANWPSLKKDQLFLQLRVDYGLSYLESCFDKSSPSFEACLEQSNFFWNNSKDPIRVGSGLGDLYQKYHIEDVDLWNYYKAAVKSPFAQFYCGKESIRPVVLNKLSLEIGFEFDTKVTKDELSQLIDPSCLNELTTTLQELLYDKNPVLSTMSFQILRMQQKLTQGQKDFFLTKLLLESYDPGPLYNMAWNNLSSMAQDHERRISTVKELQKLDPLPGKVFALKDLKKKKVIANYLSNKFPEYFDYYAKTCLDYYEGRREFPFGIPTPDCEDFFKVVKDNSLQAQELHLRYSAIKK